MWCIRSEHLNNFIMENGLEPVYEGCNLFFYKGSRKLRELITTYSIQCAFKNRRF